MLHRLQPAPALGHIPSRTPLSFAALPVGGSSLELPHRLGQPWVPSSSAGTEKRQHAREEASISRALTGGARPQPLAPATNMKGTAEVFAKVGMLLAYPFMIVIEVAHFLSHNPTIGPYVQKFVQPLRSFLSSNWPLLANPVVAFPLYTIQIASMGLFAEDTAWFGMMLIYFYFFMGTLGVVLMILLTCCVFCCGMLT